MGGIIIDGDGWNLRGYEGQPVSRCIDVRDTSLQLFVGGGSGGVNDQSLEDLTDTELFCTVGGDFNTVLSTLGDGDVGDRRGPGGEGRVYGGVEGNCGGNVCQRRALFEQTLLIPLEFRIVSDLILHHCQEASERSRAVGVHIEHRPADVFWTGRSDLLRRHETKDSCHDGCFLWGRY